MSWYWDDDWALLDFTDEKRERGAAVAKPAPADPDVMTKRLPVKEAVTVDPREELRTQYRDLTGTAADGRWSVDRLTAEIDKALAA